MPMLVAGLLLVWLSSILLGGFLRANPAILAVRLRKAGGWLALGFALFMMVKGEFNVAFGAACFGFWLLGTRAGPMRNPFAAMATGRWGPKRRTAATSRVRTASIEMTLDQTTGRITGLCTAGPFVGRSLDALSSANSVGLHRWCLGADPEGARLLETYLDRRFPGWRDAADDGTDAGRSHSGFGPERPARMAESQAYQVLGLAEGASREEITRAHRRLMKQYHPDYGGSTDMAARVNEAKDVLMRRHP